MTGKEAREQFRLFLREEGVAMHPRHGFSAKGRPAGLRYVGIDMGVEVSAEGRSVEGWATFREYNIRDDAAARESIKRMADIVVSVERSLPAVR